MSSVATPRLTADTLLSNDAFLKVRDQKKEEIFQLKKARRVACGPYAVFYFECFETLWWQTQEMLRIEDGGAEQIEDELQAYAPLVPSGNDWVATLMLEIPDAAQRRQILGTLGHVEEKISIRFEGQSVQAEATDDIERTTQDGKTSAVHFLRFVFSEAQKNSLKEQGKSACVELCIAHPRYQHTTQLAPQTLCALLKDFS